MSQPFIFVSTSRLKPGKLDAYRDYWQEFCRDIESREPRLIAINAYVNETATEVTVVQVHPDVASMQVHMEVARERIGTAYAEFLEATTEIRVFGHLTEEATAMMKQLAGPDVAFSVSPVGIGGFTRSGASA